MSAFIINSLASVALKLTEIHAVMIVQDEKTQGYNVIVRTNWLASVTFETASTFAEAQAKAGPLMTALG